MEQKAQYNTLNRIITEIMIKAESLLPSKRHKGWSPKLLKLVYKIRYLRLLRKSIQGLSISQRSLEQHWHHSGSNFYSRDRKEVESELRKSWKEFRQVQQEAKQHRRQHMQEILSYHPIMDNEATSKAVQ